ncbi:MAG: hypothetical protein CR974_01530 [Gammaproteobacteria bacterium]|nr:MAG: hypothetical protein CR974_01530 [Gammaproteobacteria bacterium]
MSKKNDEVKDDFKAKGLKEANDVLDIMRLEEKERYGYNRYLDSLHLKASEAFSLEKLAEFEVREDEKTLIAKNMLKAGLENRIIAETTGLSIEKIEALKNLRTP